jgi:predicted RNase H-like HicB family nuclease
MRTYQEFAIDYFQDEDGMFTARVSAINGCLAWGKTLEGACRNSVDAIGSWLEARKEIAATKLCTPCHNGLSCRTVSLASRACDPQMPA